jgi:hypothetical protein
LNPSQRTIFLATALAILGLVLIGLISQSGLAVQFNLGLQQWTKQASVQTKSEFVLLELPQREADIETLLSHLQKASAKRLFWVLPDEQLAQKHLTRIAEFNLQTIKIPGYTFNNQGLLVQHSASAWQPSAGYLIDIENNWGVSRTIPVSTPLSPILNSPTRSLHDGLSLEQRKPTDQSPSLDQSASPNHWSAPRYIDFSKVNINSPIMNNQMLSAQLPGDKVMSDSLVGDLFAGKDIYLVSDFKLTQARVVIPGPDAKLNWHPVQYHAAALLALSLSHKYPSQRNFFRS